MPYSSTSDNIKSTKVFISEDRRAFFYLNEDKTWTTKSYNDVIYFLMEDIHTYDQDDRRSFMPPNYEMYCIQNPQFLHNMMHIYNYDLHKVVDALVKLDLVYPPSM